MRVVGIDPGISGGLACIDIRGNLIDVVPMPVVSSEVQPIILKQILETWEPDLVAIEQVSSMPGQGVASTFKFGVSFGTCIGVVGAMGLRMERVRPQQWKKTHTLIGKDKDASRHKATELWPSMATRWKRKADNGLTDAALIAEHARRVL